MYLRFAKIAHKLDEIHQYELADQIFGLLKLAQAQPATGTMYNPYDKIQSLESTVHALQESNKKTEQRQDGTIARLMQQIKSIQNQMGNINGNNQEQIQALESQQDQAAAAAQLANAGQNNQGGLDGLSGQGNESGGNQDNADISL